MSLLFCTGGGSWSQQLLSQYEKSLLCPPGCGELVFPNKGRVTLARCNRVRNVDHSILPVACETKVSWAVCVVGSISSSASCCGNYHPIQPPHIISCWPLPVSLSAKPSLFSSPLLGVVPSLLLSASCLWTGASQRPQKHFPAQRLEKTTPANRKSGVSKLYFWSQWSLGQLGFSKIHPKFRRQSTEQTTAFWSRKMLFLSLLQEPKMHVGSNLQKKYRFYKEMFLWLNLVCLNWITSDPTQVFSTTTGDYW